MVVCLRRRGVVLWPVYFDLNRSRSEGRRVSRRLAVPSPSVERVRWAVERLGLRCRVVSGVAYPRLPWRRSGFVLVEERVSKGRLIKDVARVLRYGSSEMFK